MRDMVDLVFVQADALHQIDLDLIAGGKSAHQRRAIKALGLCDSENWRNIIARMAILRREEGIVEIKLSHCYAIGPGRPFRADLHVRCKTK